jgi:outer membrane protein OmpA-like peptidoglycan-associated protein
MTPRLSHLFPLFALVLALLASGCAGPKSTVVLLPEGGRASGVVEVSNRHGEQLLNQPWQAVEVKGRGSAPSTPVLMGQAEVQRQFGSARAAMPAAPLHFLLYFEFGSTELLPASEQLLPEIVKAIKARHPAQVAIVGHADTVGSIEYNYQLGLRRAAAVAERLAALGAAPVSSESASRGKSEPLVKTADETPEPRNRRAEVTIR